MRKFRLMGIFSVCLIFTGSPGFPASVSNRGKPDGKFVLKTVSVLFCEYYDPTALNHVGLLNAALFGIAKELNSRNIDFQPDCLPADLSIGIADHLFLKEFFRAEKALGGKTLRQPLAFLAADYLVKSVQDSHTAFIYPDRLELAMQAADPKNKASYCGIGILPVELNGDFYIARVMPNSPAERIGVKRFDWLLAVNGKKPAGNIFDLFGSLLGKKAAGSLWLCGEEGKLSEFP